MSSPHVEVIPRIIDTSIAATYQAAPTPQTVSPTVVENDTSEASTTPVQEAVSKAPTSFTQRFFSTLKDYLIPILFVISVIVVVYIMWKYWTSYRNVSVAATAVIPTNSTNKESLSKRIPCMESNKYPSESKEDLSKYILASQSDAESVRSKLSTVSEGEEESSASSDNENSSDDEDDSSDDEHASLPSLICESDDMDNHSVSSEPDFNMIANLINAPIEEEHIHSRFEYLESIGEQPDTEQVDEDLDEQEDDQYTHQDPDGQSEQEEDIDQEEDQESPVRVQPKKSKRAKRIKRLVL